MTMVFINTATKKWTTYERTAYKWQKLGYPVIWCHEYELKKILAKI